MSIASQKLKEFEKIALSKVLSELGTGWVQVTSKTVFAPLEIDGVFKNSNNDYVLVEVALGGSEEKLKSGPLRKLLADGFKLGSADTFFKGPGKIVRKVILVKAPAIKDALLKGWAKSAYGHFNIDVTTCTFSNDELVGIKNIIQECINEQLQKPEDHLTGDSDEI